MSARALPRRSAVKAVTYRLLIVCMDFATIYLMTGKAHLALGFMIVSNLYTTIAYVLHERIWARIRWGLRSTSAERARRQRPRP